MYICECIHHVLYMYVASIIPPLSKEVIIIEVEGAKLQAYGIWLIRAMLILGMITSYVLSLSDKYTPTIR